MAPGDAHPYLAPFYVVITPLLFAGVFYSQMKTPPMASAGVVLAVSGVLTGDPSCCWGWRVLQT